jgi:hypothetical protein
MHQRLRFRSRLGAIDQFGLEVEALLERQARGREHRLDRAQGRCAIRVLSACLRRQPLTHRRRRARRIHQALRCAPRSAAARQQRVGIGYRTGAHLDVDLCIEEAQFQCARDIHRPRIENQIQRAFDPDEPRHTLGAAGAGDDAKRDFRQAEARAGQRHPVMTGERNLKAPAQYRAVHARDDRNLQGFQFRKQPAVFLLLRRTCEFADVGARKERAARAHQHHGADVRPPAQRGQRLEQLLARSRVDGVDRRVVDRDDRDPAGHLERHDHLTAASWRAGTRSMATASAASSEPAPIVSATACRPHSAWNR